MGGLVGCVFVVCCVAGDCGLRAGWVGLWLVVKAFRGSGFSGLDWCGGLSSLVWVGLVCRLIGSVGVLAEL